MLYVLEEKCIVLIVMLREKSIVGVAILQVNVKSVMELGISLIAILVVIQAIAKLVMVLEAEYVLSAEELKPQRLTVADASI